MPVKLRADALMSNSEKVHLHIGNGDDYISVSACYLTACIVVLEEQDSKLIHFLAFESREAWEEWEKRKAWLLRNYIATVYEKGHREEIGNDIASNLL